MTKPTPTDDKRQDAGGIAYGWLVRNPKGKAVQVSFQAFKRRVWQELALAERVSKDRLKAKGWKVRKIPILLPETPTLEDISDDGVLDEAA